MSSHRLEVEAGRWARTNIMPVDERKCTICRVLEDDYHFVIERSRYLDLRNNYIAKYYWKMPSMYKFVELISSSNMNCLLRLSLFLYHTVRRYSELLHRN